MSYFVAVDTGCIECGESTNVIGIFSDERTARFACDEHELRQAKNWRGEHYFDVYEAEEIDQIYPVEYDSGGFDHSADLGR